MSELGEAFARQPPHTDKELDQIIQYMREYRAKHLSGVKPAKPKAPEKIDISELDL
jgi:hypothetical protein